MKTSWWLVVLGLFCMPVGVRLQPKTVSQEPLSISLMKVNSSAELRCFTRIPGALGFSLYRYFNGNREVVYLNLKKGVVTMTSVASEFKNRIHVDPDQQISEGLGFNVKFSLLGVGDTDVYFCAWKYFTSSRTEETRMDKGTMIIIREKDLRKHCTAHPLDHIIIFALSVTGFSLVLMFFISVLLLRCTQFKPHFRSSRVERISRTSRPLPIAPQDTFHQRPYLNTSAETPNCRDSLYS